MDSQVRMTVMMQKFIFCTLLAGIIGIFTSTSLQAGSFHYFVVQNLLKEMSLEEKAGQLIMTSYKPTQDQDALVALIEDHIIGGVMLLGTLPAPAEIAALTNIFQTAALSVTPSIPLFISIDQEGGQVARMKTGATWFPPAMALGAIGSESLAYKVGVVQGKELRAVGVQMDFAPVMDVNNNPDNPVIGRRSFGSSPQLVTKMGNAYIKGLQKSRVMATAKHFPGHGDTKIDSHYDLPVIDHPLRRLKDVELIPFQSAIARNVDLVMVAHIIFPALDSRLPASLSPVVVTDLLRKQMKFQGLIITDDLSMAAIRERFSPEESAVQAIKAGSDIALSVYPPETVRAMHQRIVEAVRKGEITPQQLDQSVSRIIHFKLKYGLFDTPVVPLEEVRNHVALPHHLILADEVRKRSVTLLHKDISGKSPVYVTGNIAILTTSPFISQFAQTFVNERGYTAKVINLSGQHSFPAFQESNYTKIVAIAEDEDDLAIIRSSVSSVNKEKLTLAVVGSPYLVKKELPPSNHILIIYSRDERSLFYLLDTLFKNKLPSGSLPVTL